MEKSQKDFQFRKAKGWFVSNKLKIKAEQEVIDQAIWLHCKIDSGAQLSNLSCHE